MKSEENVEVEEIAADHSSEVREIQGPIQQFLSFAIMDEEYCVDIMQVREIKGWSDTTRLPNCPEFLKGVINLRGVVIPIFDLKGCFEMGMSEPTPKNVVIILAVGERLVGVLVDSVSDILSVGANQVRPSPHVETKVKAEFINGLISVDEKMVVVLNTDRLFDPETLHAVDALSD